MKDVVGQVHVEFGHCGRLMCVGFVGEGPI